MNASPPPHLDSEMPVGFKASDRPPTWSEVAMRTIADGPYYAILVLVGVLALRGTADVKEFVFTSLATLLAKSWPRAVQIPTGK